MIEVKLNEASQWKDQLSWKHMFTKRDLIALEVDIPSFMVQDYDVVLYEYVGDKPAKRWSHRGKWKRGYTLSFDMTDNYLCKVGVRYLLTFVLYNSNIQVEWHGQIQLNE